MTTLESTTPSLLVTTEEPTCPLGLVWVIALSACMPELDTEVVLEPRTSERFPHCPEGYFLHITFRQCLRKKYHVKPGKGQVGRWWENTKKPDPHVGGHFVTRATTRYTGKWYAYGSGFGSDHTYP